MKLDALQTMLIRHEGMRLSSYRDTAGNITIGVGHNITANGIDITQEWALHILDADIQDAVDALDGHLPWWTHLDDIRQRVLVDMCFNMGIGTLLTFTNFLQYVHAGSYHEASVDLEKTKWAAQVGNRAKEDSYMMDTGKDFQGD